MDTSLTRIGYVFSFALAFSLGIALSSFPVHAADTASSDIPSDISTLLQKDPTTLTDEEQQKLSEYFSTASGSNVATTAPEGTVNCFDYYTFGSVQVDVNPLISQTVPGVPITFSGTIKNQNPYPLIGGSVYAKVFRKSTNASSVQVDGYDVVDQFFVEEGITVAANGSVPLSFDWTVPRNAPSGDYQVAFFFVTAKRFNLLGLSFTDDVVGNQANFSITSDATVAPVAFDKGSVLLNGTAFHFAAFPPHFQKDDTVKAEMVLVNPSKEDRTVSVSWKQYDWDGLRQENLVTEKTEAILVKANEKKSISYETKEYKGAVTYLVVEARDGASKSILDIRFVRDDVEQVRMNFPGIMSFPLKAVEENTVFSCIHATNSDIVNGTELTLELKDTDGKVIHTYDYQGGITGNMMGVKDTFIPEKDYGRFTLSATLKKDGKVVEALDQNYDCQNIDPSLCPVETVSGLQSITEGSGTKHLLLILSTLLPIAVLGWYVVKKLKR